MPESLDARAKRVFDQVIDRTGRERALQLDRACADAPELRARVVALLAAAEKNDSFLNGPTLSTDLLATAARDEQPGACIGPYTLLELIGEGGFGSVFLAEQTTPVRRQVALKIIKAGMDTKRVIARFEAERQVLALMEHPHIARVLEAGATGAGRPYFVMELVRGEPVTRFCDRRQLTLTQRLNLFRDICAAVQHAHQKGVIHRDLKPSNILVTETEGRTLPKVIDFGIAKAIAGRWSGDTLTEVHQLIGTPEYMSPEQADLSDVDIDTRSDIYSLGVLLYELLAGTTPFDRQRLAGSGFDGLRRIICDEEPPRPSLRLQTFAPSSVQAQFPQSHRHVSGSSHSSVAEIATRRRTEPALLARTLRGDLDWIVLKCLEKDRARRYETAGALSDDIGRYLENQPVRATPPSTGYRLRKFLRRNRVAVSAGTVAILGLATGLGAALYGLQIAQQQRDAAFLAEQGEERQRKTAERVATFMGDMLAAASPEIAAGHDPTLLRNFLERSVERIERGELRDSPEAEADLRLTIANVYRAIGDIPKVASLLEPLETRLAAIVESSERLSERYLDSKSLLLSAQSRFEEATEALNDLIALRRRTLGESNAQVAWALVAMANNTMSQGRLEESLDTLHEALQIAEASGDHATLANVLTSMAEPLGALGRSEEAVEAAQRALDNSRQACPGDHPHVADSINNLAAALRSMPGQEHRVLDLLNESVEMKRRLYPDGHPHLGVSLHNLALTLQEHGDLDAAELRYSESLEMLRRYRPLRDDDLAATLLNFCGLAARLEQHERREAFAREALAICEALYPQGHVNTSFALLNIGNSLRASRRHEESVGYFEQAVFMQRQVLDPADPLLASSLAAAASALVELRRYEEAVTYLRDALVIRRAQSAADPASLAGALAELAAALGELPLLDAAREAAQCARESVEIRAGILSPGDWRLANARSILGGALVLRAELDADAQAHQRLATLDEAEQLLSTGFKELEAAGDRIPAAHRARILTTAARRLARLYQVWHTLDPSAEKAAARDAWQAKVLALSQPTP